jgi:hypothetical protein
VGWFFRNRETLETSLRAREGEEGGNFNCLASNVQNSHNFILNVKFFQSHLLELKVMILESELIMWCDLCDKA